MKYFVGIKFKLLDFYVNVYANQESIAYCACYVFLRIIHG